jgi:hypothetical protein
MPRLRAQLPALMLLAACSVGTTGRNYAPAKGPAGGTVSLELDGQRTMIGELLAVQPGSLLLLEGRELVRVPIPIIRTGYAPKVSFTAATFEQLRGRLRLISRYPQGVSPELEARLLEAYQLTRIREVS